MFKAQFWIFATVPEHSIKTQATLVQALCVVHNIICIYDSEDILSREESDKDIQPDTSTQQFTLGVAEQAVAENLHEQIVEAM